MHILREKYEKRFHENYIFSYKRENVVFMKF